MTRPPQDSEEILTGLDPEQRAAAESLSGPVVILAGAGTGKTRAITHRIAHGVVSGAFDPRRTLAVTFTARAAGELRHRLGALGATGVQARTFHSSALRQLRYFWPRVIGGAPPQILTAKVSVLAPVLARSGHADRSLVRDVAAEIEWAKARQIQAVDYAETATSEGRSMPSSMHAEDVGAAYAAYDERKSAAGYIDFEDVLLLTVGILDTRPDVLDEVQLRYRWFTVDEYQDVNPLQHRLLSLWLGDRDDLCVVGDPSQTIYTFTGASSRYLLEFAATRPHATKVELVRSYRSTPQIVATANAVLAAGAASSPIRLRSTRSEGVVPAVNGYADEAAEADGAATAVARLVAAGMAPRSIAILYRINATSERFENALASKGISYVLRGESAFFDRPEIREAMTRLRGAARAPDGDPLPAAVRTVLGAMDWREQAPSGGGATRERWENLLRLCTLADDTAAADPEATIADLVAELESRAEVHAAPSADGVTLCTVHAAKGMEWEAVFVVGLTAGGFPITYADTPDRLEEERRLFYVAVTRARDRLFLTWARTRDGRSRRDRSPLLEGLSTAVSVEQVAPSVSVGSGSRARPRANRRRPATCNGCGKALVTGTEIARGRCRTCPRQYDPALLDALKAWRLGESRSRSVPAFVVCTDATLELIATQRPRDAEALRAVPGIGPSKLESYGAAMLDVVAAHAGATA